MSTFKSLQFKSILLCCISLTSWVSSTDIKIGNCTMITNGKCPHPDVQFFLFTKQNPSEPQIIGTDNISASTFNPQHKTKIIIHGYSSNRSVGVLEDIRKAYLSSGDYNVIAVDWSKLGPAPCYPTAVFNARFVGQCIAQLVNGLLEEGDTSIHLVGFSLGAHIAGFTSNSLEPYIPPRITGLDPAAPLFETIDKNSKLDASDAEFVDVIHTNAILKGQLEPSGHVNFYVNGGTFQPGCPTAENNYDLSQKCSHARAPTYFAESINSENGFYAWPCDPLKFFTLRICPCSEPKVVMGEHVPHTTRGIYGSETASQPPFALGPNCTKI